ncbi:type I-C CRISPR-associated protein Cas5c [Fundicoccus culcitae]|uniref:pre-crRNA processing endonuclease n=1 Tax=Fundicoccus culcitae TaxID=2969821 RepID=A0ABY5P2W3_9LACT|nr:type I-C CRISPR-associated protein Cas5c [Fundicoccus culcitae]UUX32773.1 type I-C CRISPR-associated protein Cas5c [Fundicoccus culcitae]
MEEFKSENYYYRLYGDYALFTDPQVRGGGEKFTYQVPTFQSIVGITEQIYWKPTLKHIIDEVVVINEIITEPMGIRPVTKDGTANDLSYYTYLRDVEYFIKGHFVWSEQRENLKSDRNEKKHQAIFNRSLARGGRRDLFLGTRECVAFVEPITQEEYLSVNSFYKNQKLSLGLMYHSLSYPSDHGRNELIANYDNCVMNSGVIKFSTPKETSIHYTINDYSIKDFSMGLNLKSVDEEGGIL